MNYISICKNNNETMRKRNPTYKLCRKRLQREI